MWWHANWPSDWQVSKGIRDDERCGRAELLFCDEGAEPARMLEACDTPTTYNNTTNTASILLYVAHTVYYRMFPLSSDQRKRRNKHDHKLVWACQQDTPPPEPLLLRVKMQRLDNNNNNLLRERGCFCFYMTDITNTNRIKHPEKKIQR